MNKFLTIICILLFTLSAFGQSIVGEFKLPVTQVSNIQTLLTGDSIFYSFKEKKPGLGDQLRAGWLIGNTPHPLFMPDIGRVAFTDVTHAGNLDCIYFFQKTAGALWLKCLAYDRSNNNQVTVNECVAIKGEVLATFVDTGSNLNVIAHDSRTGMLLAYLVKGVTIVAQHEIPLPEELAEQFKVNNDLEFYQGGSFDNFAVGSSKKKLIHDGSRLYLIVDTNRSSSTTILSMSLPAYDFRLFQLSRESKGKWISHITNGTFYQLTIKNREGESELILDAFKIDPIQKIYTRLLKGHYFKGYASYFRDAKDNSIKKERNFKPSDNNNEISLAISSQESGFNTVRIGSTHINGGVRAGPPVVAAAVYLATTAASREAGGPVASIRYGYLIESKDHTSLALSDQNSNIPIQQRVDDYEIALDDKLKIRERFYMVNQKNFIAVYHLPKEDKLLIVKF